MKFAFLILKNIRRNLLRSTLTGLGTMVLVFVVTLVWSILALLDMVTVEKSQNLKAIVTERWSIPSRMPFAYADSLSRGAAQKQLRPDDVEPVDSMTWQFYGGTVDPAKITRDSIVFAIACDPDKLLTMMDGLESLSPEQEADLRRAVDRLKRTRQGIILGRNQLVSLGKQVTEGPGDRITLHGIGNFKGLDLEFEIVGAFPPGRYDGLGAIHRDYFNNQMDTYPQRNRGRKHLLADKTLNLVWLKLRDTKEFERVNWQIDTSPDYAKPAVKCETASSGTATFMEAFRDLIWVMRWPLAFACLGTLSLIIANAISISVRERRQVFAVLKVLGFRPGQILLLVLGEALAVGAGAGLASAGLTYAVINWGMGGISFPMGFFDRFFVPLDAIWWGPAVGAGAALLGAMAPAWFAQNVKVADVFAKVA